MSEHVIPQTASRPLEQAVAEFKLDEIARALVPAEGGILAADESTGTIKKRFDSIKLESTEANRQAYRQLLFTTDRAEKYISGVILYDETIRQSTDDGLPFPKLLSGKGIIPGIKVDKGAKPLAGFPGETVTEGLDGLRDRLVEYRQLGARFAKWRAVINIGPVIPSRTCLEANAHALARYAALSQETGLVPIVEPEVLMDGDHSLERCDAVTETTLKLVYSALYEFGVILEGTLLKPNMVIAGKGASHQAGAQEVGRATVRCLERCVPVAVPGIVFLSGGQSPEQATENLNAMNAMGKYPWQLSFSYGRALQEPVLRAWGGKRENVPAGQAAFFHRAKCNGAARLGSYSKQLEVEAA
jgi:fructose-bisphosphate aldolase class I